MSIYDEVKQCVYCGTDTVYYICRGFSESGHYCTKCERKHEEKVNDGSV